MENPGQRISFYQHTYVVFVATSKHFSTT